MQHRETLRRVTELHRALRIHKTAGTRSLGEHLIDTRILLNTAGSARHEPPYRPVLAFGGVLTTGVAACAVGFDRRAGLPEGTFLSVIAKDPKASPSTRTWSAGRSPRPSGQKTASSLPEGNALPNDDGARVGALRLRPADGAECTNPSIRRQASGCRRRTPTHSELQVLSRPWPATNLSTNRDVGDLET